ncbi:DUF1207 domain-containing protein [Stratiformator vulcanicus]|uniref:DUF1207 domain-containing protein n=1 Tax=Stratiformator vulcanicus TaxID=2527980 RepID=UPI002877507F|nr:DUF1207 domain-containing protein [Stratiformator vulcanicus]
MGAPEWSFADDGADPFLSTEFDGGVQYASHTDIGGDAEPSWLEPIPTQSPDESAPEPVFSTDVAPASGYHSPYTAPASSNAALCDDCCYRWHLLPEQVLFKPYIAGIRTPRMAAEIVHDYVSGENYFDSALGGTVGVWRYGTGGLRPDGWQMDVSAAAFLRQNASQELDVDAVDFRVRVPITYRQGSTAFQFGYDHISSHAGDEFLKRNPGFVRLNYLRDSLIFAIRQDLTDDLNVYAEIDYAVNFDIAEPWVFQFGAEYSPFLEHGWNGAPVVAVNTQLREDLDFDPSISVIAGWQWLSPETDNIIRLGLRYYRGYSQQYSFFNQREELLGVGLYYDF